MSITNQPFFITTVVSSVQEPCESVVKSALNVTDGGLKKLFYFPMELLIMYKDYLEKLGHDYLKEMLLLSLSFFFFYLFFVFILVLRTKQLKYIRVLLYLREEGHLFSKNLQN